MDNSISYNIGDAVRVTASFTDLTGLAADPTTVVFRVKDPRNVLTTQPATKLAVGTYYADVVLNSAGIWFYRWEGTGAVIAADEGRIQAKPSAFYQS